MDAWAYLENGGKHAELIWHRRSGKDEVCLHRAACAAFERKANYWHMLPEYSQARKAIWNAVNPHTGLKRIDEAFPHELRKTTREQEMQIVFKNGSTWQVIGSDNFNSLVGSTPAGIVYSEWALANPESRSYLRPILAENNGWQIFITTPRGKNHAHRTFNAARNEKNAFAQILGAYDTGIFSDEFLDREKQAYMDDFGEDQGLAKFEQEYLCSFDAAILGAVYGAEIRLITKENRITNIKYDDEFPVHTAWDLGRRDATAIWFYQVIAGEVRFIDFHQATLKEIDYYIDYLKNKSYRYGDIKLPHDGRAKTLASGRSIQELLADAFSWAKIEIVPSISLQDGINAARRMFKRAWFDHKCDAGIEALAQYHYEWSEENKRFTDTPKHDWTSHPADAFRMAAVAWQHEPVKKEEIRPLSELDLTINELIKRNAERKRREY